MKFTIYSTKEQRRELEYEVLSQEFYAYITRHLMHWTEEPEHAESIIFRKNIIINLSSTLLTRNIYVLESDDNGFYQEAEYAWHDSNFHLAIRRLDTLQFIEFVGEILDKEIIDLEFINDALKEENASFEFINKETTFGIKVFPIGEIEAENFGDQHQNIRLLVDRMDNALSMKDYSNVLHSSATIFETMAKEVISSESIQNESLGGFFNKYRNESKLPPVILDYILEIYKKRNTSPLAGHGSLAIPTVTNEEAVILCQMTKAFVKIESELQRQIGAK
ncbi:hypothetical protein [Flavobacterium sp. GSB-24]|uniref:hypothetical protein n=1 Tax=Flavobacterium sp. GSB-24 TaxID=2994319 RepID=UPI0024901294|nr:hypothetical protein [Flavobacterium sp. GSB-24]BDU25172.1 hypothetical protein FLGSB24_19160 [Flavobacterium sp. GSB-24]